MQDREKLKVFLEHWLEHNREHCKDLRQWADKARSYEEPVAADNILKAVDHLNEAGGYLALAQDQMETGKA